MSPERRPPKLILEEITRIAKEVVLEHGSHVPTLIVESDRGPILSQIRELPDTHEGRLRLMHAAGFMLARSGEVAALKQVVFICEGWMSVVDEEGHPPVMPPSQDPNRKEVLFIDSLKVESQQSEIVCFEMVRDREGQLFKLERLESPMDEGGHSESPLLDAFVAGFQSGMRGRGN